MRKSKLPFLNLRELLYRGKDAESNEAKTARDPGEHVEGDNGRPFITAEQTHEEMRHVGESRASHRLQ